MDFNWPLINDNVSYEDRKALAGFILSGNRLTNGVKVKEFENHLNSAKQIHDNQAGEMYAKTEPHRSSGHLESFINHTVRTGEKPSVPAFKNYIQSRFDKSADKLKSEKGKAKKQEEAAKLYAQAIKDGQNIKILKRVGVDT